MPLTSSQTHAVEEVLRNSLRHKFRNYNPEPASMPFHTRLLGKDRHFFHLFTLLILILAQAFLSRLQRH
jgi:type II restriction enzyme